MRILVTGGRGFLGSYATPLLDQSYQVEVTDRETIDVTDLEAVKETLARSRPDVVCHLAALCGAQPSRERPQEYFSVNALGTVNVLEACRALGITRFVLTSSLTVHGAGDRPMDEISPYAPRHPYAATKVAAEFATLTYSRCFGIRSIVLRPTLIVGEGYKEGHAIGQFVETILRGDDIVMFGDGSHRRDFVHPEDVARAIFLAVERLADPGADSLEVFNISSGVPISMSELADVIISLAGGGRKVFGPPTGQTFSLHTRIDRAEKLLNWRPQIGTEEIVTRVLRHFREGDGAWRAHTSQL